MVMTPVLVWSEAADSRGCIRYIGSEVKAGLRIGRMEAARGVDHLSMWIINRARELLVLLLDNVVNIMPHLPSISLHLPIPLRNLGPLRRNHLQGINMYL